ncbi:2'-5' RNA ligase [Deinobacterium chartae]|uniref:2'-5' RNA ligase n=1 Tax=Deinobacterium chartae TaxID=521158 RepID=A0A841HZA5_9DEIO|nr:hypothetical protein [Deinobacterium chartae]MBB6098196.1 2'-5' RNA ligase [Deinobacterium chartae]
MSFRFAIYYVPPRGSEFYRLGSEVLGYDLRATRELELSEDLRARIGDLDPAWRAAARPFGFHLTLGEALEVDPLALPLIEEEISDLLACLSPESSLTLHAQGLERWEDGKVWVLRYRASEALAMLQALFIARTAPFGRHSDFVDEVRADPGKYGRAFERRRLRKFLSPRGLDTWQPHFTLLNPFGGEGGGLARRLERSFEPYQALEVESVCLMLQQDDKPWRIRREFPRLT